MKILAFQTYFVQKVFRSPVSLRNLAKGGGDFGAVNFFFYLVPFNDTRSLIVKKKKFEIRHLKKISRSTIRGKT